MSHANECKRILLSGQPGLRVHYCEAHHTVELEMGAMSLRLDEAALVMMNEALDVAVCRLQDLQSHQGAFDAFMRQLRPSGLGRSSN